MSKPIPAWYRFEVKTTDTYKEFKKKANAAITEAKVKTKLYAFYDTSDGIPETPDLSAIVFIYPAITKEEVDRLKQVLAKMFGSCKVKIEYSESA
jgi:predicted Zn-dependent peptidase